MADDNKLTIAVDAAGGDYAPQEVVKGAIKAAHEYKVNVALVGQRQILHVMIGGKRRHSDVTIVDATEVIEMGESAVTGVKNKPDSSIVVGIELLRTHQAAAFVSAGNTGAVVAASMIYLGKRPGVERPALGGIINLNPPLPVILVDVGAVVDCRPSFIVEFARLGAEYFSRIYDLEMPRVALLNNGEEAKKGNRLARDAHVLLQGTRLNFIGNIEGQDIIHRAADVVVTDGFSGNLVLKTMEGVCDTFVHSLRSLGYKLNTISHPDSRELVRDLGLFASMKQIDYREYGGACLLGINGNVIVAHGRSQSRAIKNAIGLAKLTAEKTGTVKGPLLT